MLWWRAAGYCAADFFPEAGLGLYSADELGGMTDADGNVMELDSVEVPPGYGPEPVELMDSDDIEPYRLRVNGLPPPGIAAFKRSLDSQGIGVRNFPSQVPVKKAPVLRAIVEQIERRAEAGEWGDWSKDTKSGADRTESGDEEITDAEIVCNNCNENPCICDETAEAEDMLSMDRDQLVALGKTRLVEGCERYGVEVGPRMSLADLADAYLHARPWPDGEDPF
jgi:hypothetical protein